MGGKPVGWRNESYQHALAARGIRSRHDRHPFFKSLELPESKEPYDPYLEQEWYEGLSEELYEIGGYEEPGDWYLGSGPEFIIINRDMWNDPGVRRILRERGIK